MQLDVANM